MMNAEIRAELEKLREQIAAVAATRRQRQAGSDPQPEEDDAATREGHTEPDHNIRKQLEEIIRMFQDEVHDMPAMPTLAVFMLGVIVGRYLR